MERLQQTSGTHLPTLYPNQPVRILDQTSRTWIPGSVLNKTAEPRSYIVKTNNGSELRRNRAHIRTVPLSSPQQPKMPIRDTTSAVHHTTCEHENAKPNPSERIGFSNDPPQTQIQGTTSPAPNVSPGTHAQVVGFYLLCDTKINTQFC